MKKDRRTRILVVEDQALIAALIEDLLSDTYEVVCAQTVPDAADQLLAADIDLVLLDCVLPGGTMWQVMLEADRQEVPVVLMTGDPGQMREVAGGPRPYILKPFSIAALLDVIDAETGIAVATKPPVPSLSPSSPMETRVMKAAKVPKASANKNGVVVADDDTAIDAFIPPPRNRRTQRAS
jgi:CheY-like chemotaxis protein